MTPAQRRVEKFWRHYRANGSVDRAAIRGLASLALGEDRAAREAASALFLDVVEPLGDSFDPGDAHAYVDAFAEAIDVARRHPEAADLDRGLAELGLTSDALAARGHRYFEARPPGPIGAP